ncbi:MAG: ATP-binding cassette domain-containing protein [Pseudomonadota bacterium]|nr:ATP-binding cassette domain-containing protein [Pseudomonadota bacterium]
MLTARNLAVNGLAPFNIDIDAGKCVALSGASGSGKTLMLRALADLDPNDGEVALDGEDRSAPHFPETAQSRRGSMPSAWRRRC